MVQHWIASPPNAYLGDGYGCNLAELLQNPFGTGIADAAIAKLRHDVPLAGASGAGQINLYAQERGPDRLDIVINIAGQVLNLGSAQ
ncbi:MAG: hypothetical protein RL748_2280 [Pseudomonadota bacterium]